MNVVNLFDKFETGGTEPARYSEPSFNYLNITERKDFERTRNLIENWFARYPASAQMELRSRFRSNLNIQHQGSFFELFLHELLLKSNCNVELHPSLNDTNKKPDFLVKQHPYQDFYLEATISTGESATDASSRARENSVYDALDKLVKSPDYFLALSVQGSSSTTPPAKKIALFINNELDHLNYDEIVNNYNLYGSGSLPCWKYEHEKWKIIIRPLPKKQKTRGKIGIRPIGTMMREGFKIDVNRKMIRDSIVEKGKKYKNLDLPYVVAVNVIQPVDRIDIMDSLFGQEQYTYNLSDNPSSNSVPMITRANNGVWNGLKGLRYTRISAVLIVTGLKPLNIPRAELCLYHNPWAPQKAYQSVLTQFCQAIPENGSIRFVDGEKVSTIFELPPSWPDDEI